MRVKLCIDADYRYDNPTRLEFFVYDFPDRPHKGDIIELSHFIDESQITEAQCDQVYSLAWDVDYVCWEKDNEGVYLCVELQGD